MTDPGALRRLLPLGLGLALISAAGCRHAQPVTAPEPPAVGLYQGRIELASGKARRFRLLLWAQPPDRLHAEALSPLGATEIILDGGSGQLAVTLVRDRVSYVGPSAGPGLAHVLGVSLSLDELVRSISTGEAPASSSCRVVVAPGRRVGLPERIEIDDGGVRLVLELKRVRPRTGTGDLGSGVPPPGTRTLPLDQLEADLGPDPLAGELEP